MPPHMDYTQIHEWDLDTAMAPGEAEDEETDASVPSAAPPAKAMTKARPAPVQAMLGRGEV